MASASSSGGVGCIASAAANAQPHDGDALRPANQCEGDASGNAFELLPDFEHVHLETDAATGAQRIVHLTFGDRVALLGIEWSLERADDGFGFVMRGEDGAGEDISVLWISELLPRSLGTRVGHEGPPLVLQRAPGSSASCND